MNEKLTAVEMRENADRPVDDEIAEFSRLVGDSIEGPTIRLQKVVISNYKGVSHGTILLNAGSGKSFGPAGEESDILGLYGPNGSGKTSFIESLSIFKRLASGLRLLGDYGMHIEQGADYAEFEYTFDYQDVNRDHLTIVYGLKIKAVAEDEDEWADDSTPSPKDMHRITGGLRTVVYDEILRASGRLDGKPLGKKGIMQDIIDSSEAVSTFSPDVKRSEIVGDSAEVTEALMKNKARAADASGSFIFMRSNFNLYRRVDSKYYRMLFMLRFYARRYFQVIDAKESGLLRMNILLPLQTRHGVIPLDIQEDTEVPEGLYEALCETFESNNVVLNALVPGLSMELAVTSSTVMEDGSPGKNVHVMVKRGDVVLPFRHESDGIKRLISMTSTLSSAFNQKSFTVAIDELDSGIFEYLLGELLQAFQDGGVGQLIFTSHNLRPLEVIDKKFLCFTTTNPDERYIKLKHIKRNNNLRNTYFRELILDDQDEKLYESVQRNRIVSAFYEVNPEPDYE